MPADHGPTARSARRATPARRAARPTRTTPRRGPRPPSAGRAARSASRRGRGPEAPAEPEARRSRPEAGALMSGGVERPSRRGTSRARADPLVEPTVAVAVVPRPAASAVFLASAHRRDRGPSGEGANTRTSGATARARAARAEVLLDRGSQAPDRVASAGTRGSPRELIVSAAPRPARAARGRACASRPSRDRPPSRARCGPPR